MLDPLAVLHHEVERWLKGADHRSVCHYFLHYFFSRRGRVLAPNLIVLPVFDLVGQFVQVALATGPILPPLRLTFLVHLFELMSELAHEEGLAALTRLVLEGTVEDVLWRQVDLASPQFGVFDPQARFNHCKHSHGLARATAPLVAWRGHLAFVDPLGPSIRQV